MKEIDIVSLQMIKKDTLSCLKARISKTEEDAAKIMRHSLEIVTENISFLYV